MDRCELGGEDVECIIFINRRGNCVVKAVTNIQLCFAQDSAASGTTLCCEELVRQESNWVITSWK